MADKKISQLPNLSSSNYTSSDVLLINNGLAPYTSQTTSKTSVLNFLKYYTGTTSYLTGGTFNSGSQTLTLKNTTNNLTITGFTNTYLTGGTYSQALSALTLTNNSGTSFSVSGMSFSGAAGGLNTQIQYNENSFFSGATLIYKLSNNTVNNPGFYGIIDNTSFGLDSGGLLTGSGNTIYGYQSLVTSGANSSYSTTFGYNNLYSASTSTGNTTIGYQTSFSETTSNYNTNFGYQSLYSSAARNNNVSIGFKAMFTGTSIEDFNTVIGSNANSTSGRNNKVVIGYNSAKRTENDRDSRLVTIGSESYTSGATTTTGNEEITIIGYEAGKYITNTSAFGTTLIGFNCGKFISTSQEGNVGIGNFSLSPGLGQQVARNTCVGYAVGGKSSHTIIGSYAEGYIQTSTSIGHRLNRKLGASETVIGSKTLFNKSTNVTSQNTIIATNTLTGLTSDDFNFATLIGSKIFINGNSSNQKKYPHIIGVSSSEQTTVVAHDIMGYKSNYQNSGEINDSIFWGSVSFGNYSNYSATNSKNIISFGTESVYRNKTDYHTSVGYRAGYNLSATTNSQGNTFIGALAGLNLYSGSNNTIIGYNAQPSSNNVNNEITLGNSSIQFLRCQVDLSVLSDERDKSNIEPLNVGIEFINQLRPVKFEWNMRDGGKIGQKQIGFIAQEVDKIQNDFNIKDYLNLIYSTNEERYEFTQSNLYSVMIKSLQDLSNKNKELKERIKLLTY
jgi:hypothetical protein